mgnify:CR=1 FL=1
MFLNKPMYKYFAIPQETIACIWIGRIINQSPIRGFHLPWGRMEGGPDNDAFLEDMKVLSPPQGIAWYAESSR